ncbi:hypothetical protein Tsubulata_008163 [Turnera subulata]|uniref:Uncharacterized protein n=1 Tax=Turnera subulata TaxID=218843 RepID=A0A9Q0GH89_9ROSI|nr:hypothetical protein Tsubulata_008163 [Turnera subulata]
MRFTVHGMWPKFLKGYLPDKPFQPGPMNLKLSDEAKKGLQKICPDLKHPPNSYPFWKYEWVVRGSYQWLPATEYFIRTGILLTESGVENLLTDAVIELEIGKPGLT